MLLRLRPAPQLGEAHAHTQLPRLPPLDTSHVTLELETNLREVGALSVLAKLREGSFPALLYCVDT